MENLSIFNILSSFSKDEIKLFEKFLRSPYFNNQSTLVRIFDAIKKYYPDFESDELDRAKVFKITTGGKKYDDTLFRKYVSNLTKLAEEFLIIRNLDSDKEGKSRNLLDEYYRRRVNKMFKKTLKRVEKEKTSIFEIDGAHFFHKHLLEEIKIDYEIMNEHQNIDIGLFYDSQYYIFVYFIMLTINNLVELTNRNTTGAVFDREDIVVSFARNFNFEKFNDEIGEFPEEKYFTLKLIYLDLFLLLKPEESKYYFEMKELVRKYSDYLSINALYIYMIKLSSYCIRKVNSGDNSFVEEIFENYDFALHSEKYLAKLKQNFSFAEFRNALLFSLELHKLEWVKWFVENFIGFVNIKKRQSVKEYADAFISFEQKKFDESLIHLSKIEHIQSVMKFDTDLLLTKLYYELNYFDASYSLIDAFKHLVNHNTFMSDNVKTQFLNYLKHYRKILKLKQDFKKQNLELLKTEILNEKMLKSSRWLIEKADELDKNRKE